MAIMLLASMQAIDDALVLFDPKAGRKAVSLCCVPCCRLSGSQCVESPCNSTALEKNVVIFSKKIKSGMVFYMGSVSVILSFAQAAIEPITK
ncbi:hypothetical protein C7W93_10365 [Glaciimonas sp. PCH181]|nr:hypothetical protein C7W93_10365 [Glaciimonas sp. PCH181]